MASIVAFVGKTNSGKTTVLEGVVNALRERGYHVGAIKHFHHGVEMDRTGTDTWRFTRAGGNSVAIASPGRVWLTEARENVEPEWMAGRWMHDTDIVLCEDFKQSALPKVEVYRSKIGGELLSDPSEIVALVTDRPFPIQAPQFAPSDIAGIARFLEETCLRPARQVDSVDLFADGKRIPLGEFAQQIITRTLLGMASSLKGVGVPERLEFRVRRKSERT
ncbi:MAG: molybdopterin-guanine dinucleotide biosynthesis protein B [Dehalococcoidia bacterium]|nr:molybdopterin-guanine dinucleotide biosynthesis protein B [Dehalococcoidia bacterium]